MIRPASHATAARFVSFSLVLFVSACHNPPGTDGREAAALAAAESQYESLRSLKDAIDVGRERGSDPPRADDGEPLDVLAGRYAGLRARSATALAAVPGRSLSRDDQRALATMRRTMEQELPESLRVTRAGARTAEPDCAYDARAIAALAMPLALDSLQRRIYACYGAAARRIVVGADTLDRLTILAMTARTDDPARRRALFLSLEPMFRTVNGDDGAGSPYRAMVRLSAAGWRRTGSPVDAAARALGFGPGALERGLTDILDAWSRITPDSLIEPWDFEYQSGAAGRRLDSRVPLADLPRITRDAWAALGADPRALGVSYDLEPRAGKTPVAFTTFGGRDDNRPGGPAGTRPAVFATYRTGGLGNLNELLHETGHAVHLAGIHTRPAFRDWPDSDPFTEGIAELAALDVYEPAWQWRMLGDSVPLGESLRERYAGIVLDIAWALFEVRMHRAPESDPNRVWADLTSRYLHVRPHPELSWWARRGQLVDSPGYMMNYALGAIIAADVRARMRELGHDPLAPDPSWFAWTTARLYRFGLERPTRDVLEEFLGRRLSARALRDDMARAMPHENGGRGAAAPRPLRGAAP